MQAGKTRLIDIKFAKRFKDLDKVVIKGLISCYTPTYHLPLSVLVYVCKYGVSGSLYITKNYLCFYAKVLGMEKRKIISWSRVTNLEKLKYLSVEKTDGNKKSIKKVFLVNTMVVLAY